MTSLAGSQPPNQDADPRPDELPTVDDVKKARQRIQGAAVRTPLLESILLNQRLGGRLLVKPECLQKTGSFKFRGAYNKLSSLTDAEKACGVVAYSSGNHAQGVAAAAQMLGIDATIVMPADAPAIKLANTRAYGANVITYDRFTENREEIGNAVAAEKGAVLVAPYDDPYVMAGQGTIGFEIAEQVAELGASPEAVLVNCGGGGLISGTALALSDAAPGLPVYAVEPALFDDTKRSLESGTREAVPADARSICDALLAPKPGRLTFALNKQLLAGGFGVSDDEVRDAMRVAFTELKLVVEPGGAVSLAAILSGKIDIKGKTLVAVVSGGNVDPAQFAQILADGP
ncbi:threonine/serine dehydratase [Hwanghaeella grinnelliae]|uniref:Threonine/serine dehydratase n=1 Tax=Hwanghaeella grinnelliae TaxID=2500179 RepID=A0A437QK22_9PROT|nr:threonine/serine dehydratase [Hwanghaeella grinnelliae]RVU34855.1 threonine/serine dehydratase [Hwanghaeella grinnelliae]